MVREADNGGAIAAVTRSRPGASLGDARSAEPLEVRIPAAALRCIARWGMSKTTVDDIAREAGCSRATIYRVFPGGKDIIMTAAFGAEVSAFFADLADAIREADSLEDVVVIAIARSCREIHEDPTMRYLVEHEPESILPYVSFDGLDPLLDWSRGFAVPQLARFLDAAAAEELGEWVARLVIAYAFDHDPTCPYDLADEDDARRFVRTYLLPGVQQSARVLDHDTNTEEPTPVTHA